MEPCKPCSSMLCILKVIGNLADIKSSCDELCYNIEDNIILSTMPFSIFGHHDDHCDDEQ